MRNSGSRPASARPAAVCGSSLQLSIPCGFEHQRVELLLVIIPRSATISRIGRPLRARLLGNVGRGGMADAGDDSVASPTLACGNMAARSRFTCRPQLRSVAARMRW
jgi:hypothetical protein